MEPRPLKRVRFLLGRAGSGKTFRCLREMREAEREQPLGPALLLLVPEQATYQMNRALLEIGPRPATLRCQVLSFRRLTHLILEGELTRRRVLSDWGREMVLQALLRRRVHQWRFFDARHVRPGWAAHLARLVHELRQYRVSPPMLQRAGEELARLLNGDAPLVRKLHDLALLLEDYQAFLAERCYDSDDVAYLLTQAIRQCSWLRGARLWVDSFGDFTKLEYEILQALLHAVSEATFSLCLDPCALASGDFPEDSTRLFHRAEQTYRRLRSLIPGQTPIQLIYLPEGQSNPRFRNADLLRIEREMFADLVAPPLTAQNGVSANASAQNDPSPDAATLVAPRTALSVTLLEARHRRAEVELAARTIRRLVMHEGWRYRDIAVIVRRLEDYQALIEAIFPDYGIPFFMDVRRSVRHHPLVEFVRATIRVATYNWRRVDVIRWLRTELPTRTSDRPWMREIVDRLEQYADEHGLEGEVWRAQKWRFRAPSGNTVPEYLEPEVLNRERLRLTEPLAEFCRALGEDRAISVRAALVALWHLLERVGVAESLVAWHEQARAAGRLEEAAEHAQVWDGLVQVLEELDLAFGSEKLTREDFAAVLETALDSLTLGLVPPALDEVLIGAIERSRQPELRGVFLLGVNEGIFPLVGDEDPILNDSDREQLQQHGIELAPTAEARHFQEQYLGYIAFTRASERLWVSYAMADEQNNPLLPSPFVERLQRVFPELRPQLVEGVVHSVQAQEALTWHELASALARDIRQNSHQRGGSPMFLVERFASPSQLPVALRMVEQARNYHHTAQLPPSLARQLFIQGSDLRLTVSELESYARCPFQFFASSGLRLRARQSFRLTRQDIGELLHRILQFFVLRYVREFIRPDPESPGDASSQGELESITQREHRLREMVNEVAEAVIGELEDDRFEASARRRYVLRQAQRILGDYVLALDRQLRRGHFVPCTTELGFGQNDTRAVQWAVEFLDPADGQSIVRLFPRGRIDRIDVVPGAEDNSALENRNGSDLPDTTVQVTPLCDSARAVLPRSILWLRVVDYKLSPMSLELDRIYYGLDLQLMLYLLVAHEIFQLPIGQCCTFYAPLRRIPKSLDDRERPRGENPELDWLRGYRLSGVFPEEAAKVLDKESLTGYSPVVALFRCKDGTLGRKDASDAVGAEDLQSLADCTRRHLERIGRSILQGKMSAQPALHRGRLPCDLCSWLAVCRFDRVWDSYRLLRTLSKKEVLEALRDSPRA